MCGSAALHRLNHCIIRSRLSDPLRVECFILLYLLTYVYLPSSALHEQPEADVRRWIQGRYVACGSSDEILRLVLCILFQISCWGVEDEADSQVLGHLSSHQKGRFEVER